MGKSSQKAPNYQPVADASEKAAAYAKEQADQQLAFAKQQYYDLKPIFEKIADAQLSQMEQTQQQGEDYYDYLTSTFRPVERGLVADAQQFDTDAYRESLATQAAADAGRAFTQTRDANARAAAAMGVNPNSGKFAGMNLASELGLAAQRADAMNTTRTQADQLGWARRMDAAGLGRGLSGASVASYSAALSAGNSAGQNAMTPSNNYMQSWGQAVNTDLAGQKLQMQGLGSILNSQTSVYGTQMDSNAQMAGNTMSLFGGLGGAALGAAGRAGGFSSLFS